MPSMRVDIEAASVRQLATYLRDGAQSALVLGAAVERISVPDLRPALVQLERMPAALTNTAVGYELIGQAQQGVTFGVSAGAVTRTERYAEALLNVAAATELLGQAQRGVNLDALPAVANVPTARTLSVRPVNRQVNRPDTATVDPAATSDVRIPVGPAQRVAQLERALDEARAANNAAQIADTQAALQRAVSQRETQARLLVTNQPPAPDAPGQRKPAVNGLYQRHEALLSRQSDVMTHGNPAEQLDFHRELAAVEERINKYEEGQQPKGFVSRLMEALGTSRFNLGRVGGVEISPLVNRLGLLTGGGEAGLAGGAAGAGAGGVILAGLMVTKTAVETAARVVEHATTALRDFRSGQTESGGTTQEVAQLSATGLAGGQIASLGDQLRQRLSVSSGDPFALAAGGRAGIAPQLGPEFGGSQDNAHLVVQAFDYLRTVKATQGAEAQLLEARRLGLAGMLDQINVSEQVRQQQRQDADIQAKLFTPEQTQQARDYAAQWDRVHASLKLIEVSTAAFYVQQVADALGTLADTGRNVANVLHDNAGTVQVLAENSLKAASQQVPVLREIVNVATALGLLKGKKAAPEATAAEKQVQALRENTRAVEGLKEGFLRGGPNAEKALPAGLNREALRQALKLGAIRRKAVVL